MYILKIGLYYYWLQMFSLICKECWRTYENARSGSKFCSKECYKKSRQTNKNSICEVCGKEFHPTNPEQKYCSRECYNKVRIKDRICPICWKHFKPRANSIYCSKKCYHIAVWTHKDIKCWFCWKEFHQTTSVQMYCSKACFDKARIYLEDIKCKECWKIFHPHTKWIKYCSQECANKSEERIDKIRETNIEKHGVPYYCMTEKCRNASTSISKDNLKYVEYLQNKWYTVDALDFPVENYLYDIKVWDTFIERNPFAYHNLTFHPHQPIVAANCQRLEDLQCEARREGLSNEEELEKREILKWRRLKECYHKDKVICARENWYRCISVFDRDDKEKINYLLDKDKQSVYARKCEIRQLTYEECHDFFELYHLQWDTQKNRNNVYLWLTYEWKLIMVISFWRPRYNKNYEWEILRLCTHKDYSVVWWASKIFKHFINLVNPNSIISYCDMGKFDWKVYEQLGFKLLNWNNPSRHWRFIGISLSKKKQLEKELWYEISLPTDKYIHLTDNQINLARWFDQLLWKFFGAFGKWTRNDELLRKFGYVEIYDCGQSTFIWTRS